MYNEDALFIYTDGSCYHHPRTGGFGVRIVHFSDAGESVPDDLQFPGVPGATISEMEIYAVAKGIEQALKRPDIGRFRKVIVRTDSMFVRDNYRRAMNDWRLRKWIKADGGPVVNAPFWKGLNKAMKKAYDRLHFLPQIEWVKGHAKDEHNKAVDKLAKKSAKNATSKPISVVTVRRKRSPHLVKPGSVKLFGQKLAVNIITAQFLKVQRVYRYRYEVITKKDPHFQCVDFICSKHELRAGHRYLVTLSDEGAPPEIMHIHREYKSRKTKIYKP
jgi:ribonuclease HI